MIPLLLLLFFATTVPKAAPDRHHQTFLPFISSPPIVCTSSR
ncbi:hypothetical protein GCWU000325_00789 [Alloprevotella tannerae ATCC 51259]|uniref:Uncharacterized protein n=1 Tax=Alloprevotella tannerae ATCC 51259 TaxID=626522 RepID=C9LF08_9BACT|nr:hypothetical protein GCWU000325_00789 [Alloprevotella tannerae ATCC 51259]